MQTPSIPFKILALAPFRPAEKKTWHQVPVKVDRSNLDQVIEELGISLYVPLPESLCKTGGMTVEINKFKDLHPDSIVENIPFLNNLLKARRFIEESRTKGLSDEAVYERLKAWPDLPIELRHKPQKKEDAPSSAVEDILKMVAVPDEGSFYSGEAQPYIAQIDSILMHSLGHLFSYENFRDLEAVWQGVRLLLKQGAVNGDVSLHIVPVTMENLEDTLNNLTLSLVQDLPSLVLIDLPFDNSPRSIDLLEKIALFSESLLVPAVCWITPRFLFLDTWQDLKRLSYLPHYLDEPAFAKWRNLKGTSSARWIAVACNRFLVRYPYGTDNTPRLVRFNESGECWISPVWAVGSLISKSFHETGWPTRFTEWQSIRLEELALHSVDSGKSLATEASFNEDRIEQFIKAGIIPLVSPYNQDISFVPAETAVAGGSLGYQLFLSRITQLLFWCKDNIEKSIEPSGIEADIRKAFSLLWQKTGHPVPENLEISVVRPEPDQPAIAHIIIKPSRLILPSGEKIELELNF